MVAASDYLLRHKRVVNTGKDKTNKIAKVVSIFIVTLTHLFESETRSPSELCFGALSVRVHGADVSFSSGFEFIGHSHSRHLTESLHELDDWHAHARAQIERLQY
jgi:hypothetical protein